MKLFQRGANPGASFVQEGLRMARESESGLWCTIVQVTPELAGDLMALNFAGNRKISPTRVERYAKEMREGTWGTSNDFMAVDTTGRFVNGQHRLTAIQQADMPALIGFLFGVAPEDVLSMDTGYLRTQGQTLYFLGKTNAAQLAAVAAYDYRWRLRKKGGESTSPKGLWTTESISRHTLADIVEKRESLYREALHITNRAKDATGINHSAASLCWILFQEKDRDMADEFFKRVGTGEMLDARDPIFRLRERLMKARLGGPTRAIPPWEQVFLTIKAWNDYRRGNRRSILAWRPEEGIPEPI